MTSSNPRTASSSTLVLIVFALLSTAANAFPASSSNIIFGNYSNTTDSFLYAQILNLNTDGRFIEENSKTDFPNYAFALNTWVNGSNSLKSLDGTKRSFRNLTTTEVFVSGSWYLRSKNFWGIESKPDEYITSALTRTGPFAPANIVTAKDTIKEAVSRGIQTLVSPYLAVQHLELAVLACQDNDITLAQTFWDNAWAYLVGNEENGEGKGKMFYHQGQKRCKEACTCVSDKIISPINAYIVEQFVLGKSSFASNDCTVPQQVIEEITKNMVAVMIQGVVRELFRSDPVNFGFEGENKTEDILKKRVEGYTYAISVLPFLAQCNATVAARLESNMNFSKPDNEYMVDGYQVLVQEIRSLYPCLGVTCDQVGGFCKDVDGDDGGIIEFIHSGCPTSTPSAAPTLRVTPTPSLAPTFPAPDPNVRYSVGEIVGASIGGIVGVGLLAAVGFVLFARYQKRRISDIIAIELKDGASTHYQD